MPFTKSVGLSFNCDFCRGSVYEDASNSSKTSNVSKKGSDCDDQQSVPETEGKSQSLLLTMRTVKVRRYVLARLIALGLCLVGLSCLLGTLSATMKQLRTRSGMDFVLWPKRRSM